MFVTLYSFLVVSRSLPNVQDHFLAVWCSGGHGCGAGAARCGGGAGGSSEAVARESGRRNRPERRGRRVWCERGARHGHARPIQGVHPRQVFHRAAEVLGDGEKAARWAPAPRACRPAPRALWSLLLVISCSTLESSGVWAVWPVCAPLFLRVRSTRTRRKLKDSKSSVNFMIRLPENHG